MCLSNLHPEIPAFVRDCVLFYHENWLKVEKNTPMPSSKRAYPSIQMVTHNYEFDPLPTEECGEVTKGLNTNLLDTSAYTKSKQVLHQSLSFSKSN